MDIYIKPLKKASVTKRKNIYIEDISEIYAEKINLEKIKTAVIFTVPNDDEQNYTISVMDIIKSISHILPQATITNLGEMDTLLHYIPKQKPPSRLFSAAKIAFISLVLFFGGATAIMSFHHDAEVPKILMGYYHMFNGTSLPMVYVLDIPYSLGLGVGIIVFFNHFSKIKLTKDPTPIEVQMTTYEGETTTSIIDNLNKKKEKKNAK